MTDHTPAADMAALRTQPTVSVDQAARLLGVSRAHTYAMARDGSLPVIHLGPRRVRVPSVRLLEMLGLDSGAAAS